MDVFSEMGITDYGILLSEKDSIVYRGALAPELRVLTDPGRVHRVPDYSGATKEEREQRIDDIISLPIVMATTPFSLATALWRKTSRWWRPWKMRASILSGPALDGPAGGLEG
ncbi:MAG: hypothetical protein CM15mP84_08560 [Cellvibrionales bacterium]|nr:MAG: hypothetical protein CM15mP84_08560 [Cellvibrionales bacterium]